MNTCDQLFATEAMLSAPTPLEAARRRRDRIVDELAALHESGNAKSWMDWSPEVHALEYDLQQAETTLAAEEAVALARQ